MKHRATIVHGIALTIATVLAHASPLAAYEIRLETTSATTVQIGDIVTFDAYLDTQGESDIVLIAIGLGFDELVFAYRPDLSDAADIVLYSPSIGKGDPPRFLRPPSPPFDPPPIWPGTPPNRLELTLLSYSAGNPDRTKIGTIATATNAYLATLSFEAIAAGTHAFDWGFEHGFDSNIFDVTNYSTGPRTVDIQSQVSTPGDIVITVIPEPTTALLVGLGLLGLAVTRPAR